MESRLVNCREFIRTSVVAAGAFLVNGSGLAETESEVHICPRSPPPMKTIIATRLSELTSDSSD